MENKLTFRCWNCTKTFKSPYQITDEQKLSVRCPYCQAEAVVDLSPYTEGGTIIVMRKEGDARAILGEENLPETLPTQEPE